MSYPLWPLSLPQCPFRSTYTEQRKENTITTSIPAGIDKIRPRFSSVPVNFNIFMRLTEAQLDDFETFFNDTIAFGSLRFTWQHPRTQDPATCRIRSNPQIGEPVGVKYPLSFTLEVLVS